MRKKISCKIIKSVPLGADGDQPRQSFSENIQHPKINDIGTSIYTPRLLVIKTSINDSSTARFLDCHA